MINQARSVYLPGKFSDPIGGPNRFINMFLKSEFIQNKGFKFQSENYKGCSSVLGISVFPLNMIFPHRTSHIRKVLRVDGIYIAEDRWRNLGRRITFKEKITNLRVKNSILQSDHVIFQSEFSKNLICEHFKVNPANSSIIINGTDIKHFRPITNKKSPIPKIVVFGKHYLHQMNFAIEIYLELLKSFPCTLVIVGAARKNEFNLETMGEKWRKKIVNLGGNIQVVGQVAYDDIPSILSQQDVLLHIKYGDSCPNSVIEAMSCGVPVVCPDWGGTKELVGNAGIIVPVDCAWKPLSEHVRMFSDALKKILDEKQIYKNMARRHAEEKFNIEQVSEQYANLLF